MKRLVLSALVLSLASPGCAAGDASRMTPDSHTDWIGTVANCYSEDDKRVVSIKLEPAPEAAPILESFRLLTAGEVRAVNRSGRTSGPILAGVRRDTHTLDLPLPGPANQYREIAVSALTFSTREGSEFSA